MTQGWAEAQRSADRSGWVIITVLATAMAAAVAAEIARGHTGDALVFAVVAAGGIAAGVILLRRGSGWRRSYSVADYRRMTIGLVVFAVACWIPAAAFAERSMIAASVFAWLGVVAAFIALGTHTTSSIWRRAAKAAGPERVIALCSGARPDRRSMVLVLAEAKVLAFTDVRVRGPLIPDPDASLDVEDVTSAEIRVEGRAVRLLIRTGERELVLAKSSPVQARDFVAAVEAARAGRSAHRA